MYILNTMVQTVFKRPFIIISFGLVALVCTILNNYNPILPIVFGLSNITGGSFFESIVSTLQVMLDPGLLPGIILFLLGFALLGSLLAGVIFSGYMYIISMTLEGREKSAGDFTDGLKKYFFKVFIVALKALSCFILLLIFLMIACVPAAIITRTAMADKPEFIIAAVFIDFLTTGIIFFGVMFFRVYIFFWIPAVFKNDKKPFSAGKRIADTYFWKIVIKLLTFDIIYFVFQYIIHQIENSFLKILLSWLFSTIFFITLIVYVFNSFREYSKSSESQPKRIATKT